MKPQRWVRSSVVFVGLVVTVSAQAPRPTFEVASIRPQKSEFTFADRETGPPRILAGGLFRGTHVSVESLIGVAFDLKPFQVSGGPDWIRRERFEINARAGGGVSADQIKLMVKSLLEDRFKLVAHTEKRDIRRLALVLVRTDGTLGPYIRVFGDDCTAESAVEARKQFPPRVVPRGLPMTGQCISLSSFAESLGALFGTPVLDQTGLTGKVVFDMRIEETEQPTAGIPITAGMPIAMLGAITAALQEQLGLKLETGRGPVDVLVIDSVDRPTAN